MKSKIIAITIISLVLTGFAVYFTLDQYPTSLSIPKITWTDKNEYKIGEVIKVHGFSFQSMHLACYQLTVYNNTNHLSPQSNATLIEKSLLQQKGFLNIYPGSCGSGMTYFPPFILIEERWDQKFKETNSNIMIQVPAGNYTLYYLGNKIEISITQ